MVIKKKKASTSTIFQCFLTVVRCLIYKHAVTAVTNFETNGGPLSAISYVGIRYGMMTLLFTNKVAVLVNVSGMTSMALVSFEYQSVKTTTC